MKKMLEEKHVIVASWLMILIVLPSYLYSHSDGIIAMVAVVLWLIIFHPREEKDKKK
ncbi:MAG TPA: hypothetical protein VFK47_07915 [Ktedonobacteraceae bacterium]|nr:hypothetical protein [Ktedonobacteraceae bacterium]